MLTNKVLFQYTYDLFVIGGGSGGMASSRAAGSLGVKVGMADFVKPSAHGKTWGAGGTCVNVGCIPKKMMHLAAQLGDLRKDQMKVGWKGVDEHGQHDFNKLISTVQNVVKSLNSKQENNNKTKGVDYQNKLAKLIDNHTIELTDVHGQKETVTAKDIILAVGARPQMFKGIDPKLYITSDEIFSLKTAPGKTLVVGASYIALECAGFLSGLGQHTEVMARSVLLRKFDRQFASLVGQYMEEEGVVFHMGCQPKNIEQQGDKKVVTWVDKDNKEHREEFDTILMAIGRTPDTKYLGLENVGVKVSASGKIVANDSDQTAVPNIYAVGDCVEGRPELTPTAIMCGRKLIKRLYQNSSELMDYSNVATTIFTPLEYGSIGLSEEAAVEKYGKDNLKIFETVFKPVTWNISSRNPNICQGKLIVHKESDKILGYHYVGPSAAEVTQGFSVAMKMGATKKDFDNTVGIHPSAAEEMVQMKTFR